MKKEPKVMQIAWRDTSGFPGWADAKDLEGKAYEPDYIQTVGYLLKKTKHKVVIATGYSCWNTYLGLLTIPKCSIIGIIELVRKE